MSREVNLPDTSIAAGKLKTDESKQKDYDKICYALGKLGASHYEQISQFLNWQDPNKTSRRLLEMCPPTILNPKGKNLIYNTGAKGISKRGRAAYLYDLVRTGTEKTIPPEKLMSGTTVGEFAKRTIQKDLFDLYD